VPSLEQQELEGAEQTHATTLVVLVERAVVAVTAVNLSQPDEQVWVGWYS
jgi:hypothetical protein